jgi:hypothetical protein
MRMKFVCQQVTETADFYTYHLVPVYSQDPMHENKYFWDMTPSGAFNVTVSKEKGRFFQVGHEYYFEIHQ